MNTAAIFSVVADQVNELTISASICFISQLLLKQRSQKNTWWHQVYWHYMDGRIKNVSSTVHYRYARKLLRLLLPLSPIPFLDSVNNPTVRVMFTTTKSAIILRLKHGFVTNRII